MNTARVTLERRRYEVRVHDRRWWRGELFANAARARWRPSQVRWPRSYAFGCRRIPAAGEFARTLTLAPIWLPHCPAWICTISRILVTDLVFDNGAANVRGTPVRIAAKMARRSGSSRTRFRTRGSSARRCSENAFRNDHEQTETDECSFLLGDRDPCPESADISSRFYNYTGKTETLTVRDLTANSARCLSIRQS